MRDSRKITKLRLKHFKDLGIVGKDKKLILPPLFKLAIRALPEDIPFKIKLAMSIAEIGAVYSMMNNKIMFPKLKDGMIVGHVDVTVNNFIFMFGESGSGKDSALSTLRKALAPAMDKILNFIDKENIKLAKHECEMAGKKEFKWKEFYTKIDDAYPSLSTERGAMKFASKLSQIGSGSLNMYTSELGSALSNDGNIQQLLTSLAIAYDLGNVPRKLVSTTELQIANIKGLNVNTTMFSSMATLKREPAIKEKFMRSMEEQYARRSLFINAEVSPVERDFDSLEEADAYALARDSKAGEALEQLEIKTYKSLSNLQIRNGQIKVPLDVYLEFDRYKELNSSRADSVSKLYSFQKLSIKHAAWRALKLAGLFAMSTGKQEISLKHYHAAISVIEFIIPDIKAIQIQFNKEPYEDFIEHCREMAIDGKYGVSKQALFKYRFIASVTDKNVQELLDACNATDKTGVYTYNKKRMRMVYTYVKPTTDDKVSEVVTKEPEEEPEAINPALEERAKKPVTVNPKKRLFNASLLPLSSGLTKEQKMGRSSKGFKPVSKMTWDELAKRTVGTCGAFTPYWFKGGKRSLNNLRGTTNLLVLDVDQTTVEMSNMSMAIGRYNHIIATTSDRENKFKYRIILELDKKVDLTPKQWKVFFKSVAGELGVEVDTNIGQSGIFFGYDDAEIIINNGKKAFNTSDHLIEAYQQVNEYSEKPVKVIEEGDKDALNKLWDDRYDEFEFAYNANKGNRSTMIVAAMHRAKRMNMPKDTIKELLWDINDAIVSGGITQKRMETTVFSQL